MHNKFKVHLEKMDGRKDGKRSPRESTGSSLGERGKLYFLLYFKGEMLLSEIGKWKLYI